MKKIKNTGIEFIHFTDSVIMNNLQNIPELENVFQRKLPIMIKEQINVNKLRSDITFEKINNNKFILDYVTISLAGNCPDPLSKVYYFNNDSGDIFILNSSENSLIIPTNQSETIIRLYSKNIDDSEEAKIFWKSLNK